MHCARDILLTEILFGGKQIRIFWTQIGEILDNTAARDYMFRKASPAMRRGGGVDRVRWGEE